MNITEFINLILAIIMGYIIASIVVLLFGILQAGLDGQTFCDYKKPTMRITKAFPSHRLGCYLGERK